MIAGSGTVRQVALYVVEVAGGTGLASPIGWGSSSGSASSPSPATRSAPNFPRTSPIPSLGRRRGSSSGYPQRGRSPTSADIDEDTADTHLQMAGAIHPKMTDLQDPLRSSAGT
jgi:hypothetical protein